jgi:hypothetical protein
VGVTQIRSSLSKGADRTRVAAYFGLGEDDTYVHWGSLPATPPPVRRRPITRATADVEG